MIKECCSILCQQCEDPLLGLLVARIVEAQCLNEYGQTGRKGGYILGPIARNIISTYLLPGYLSGVEIDSCSNLSAKYSEIHNSKSKILLSVAPSVASSMKREKEGSNVKGEDYFRNNKSYIWREEKLKASFGMCGVDAAVLGLVCASWLQCNRTLDITFQHCCSLGLFSSALSAQIPLLPSHMYGIMQKYFTSPTSSSQSDSLLSGPDSTGLGHILSPPAGFIVEERVRNLLSSAALMRWLLVSTWNESSDTDIVKSDNGKHQLDFTEYRNRNLNFNSQQIRTLFTAVNFFLTEALGGKDDFPALQMKNIALKKKIFESVDRSRLRSQLEKEDASKQHGKDESTFKKACRVAFLAYKTEVQWSKAAAKMEESYLVTPPVAKVSTPSTFDIFDMPPVRRTAARPTVTATATPTAVSTPSTFDIFDMPPPVRRPAARPPATATAAAPTTTALLSLLKIFFVD